MDHAKKSITIETHTEELFRDQTLYGSRVELYHALMSHTGGGASTVHQKLDKLMVAASAPTPTPAKQHNRTTRPAQNEQPAQKNTVVTLRPPRRVQATRRKPHASVVSLR